MKKTQWEKDNSITITINDTVHKEYWDDETSNEELPNLYEIDIFGNHFDGTGIEKYEIIKDDSQREKLIVTFSTKKINHIHK